MKSSFLVAVVTSCHAAQVFLREDSGKTIYAHVPVHLKPGKEHYESKLEIDLIKGYGKKATMPAPNLGPPVCYGPYCSPADCGAGGDCGGDCGGDACPFIVAAAMVLSALIIIAIAGGAIFGSIHDASTQKALAFHHYEAGSKGFQQTCEYRSTPFKKSLIRNKVDKTPSEKTFFMAFDFSEELRRGGTISDINLGVKTKSLKGLDITWLAVLAAEKSCVNYKPVEKVITSNSENKILCIWSIMKKAEQKVKSDTNNLFQLSYKVSYPQAKTSYTLVSGRQKVQVSGLIVEASSRYSEFQTINFKREKISLGATKFIDEILFGNILRVTNSDGKVNPARVRFFQTSFSNAAKYNFYKLFSTIHKLGINEGVMETLHDSLLHSFSKENMIKALAKVEKEARHEGKNLSAALFKFQCALNKYVPSRQE